MLTFSRHGDPGLQNDPISLTGYVIDYGGGVEFAITNSSVPGADGVTASTPCVTLIAFEDHFIPLLSSPNSLPYAQSPSVNFMLDVSPGNWPQGNALTPKFVESLSYTAGSDKGLDPGESVIFRFAGADISAVENALADGSLRIGLNVEEIGKNANQSIAYLTYSSNQQAAAVPEPTAPFLGFIGTLMLLRRKNR